MTQFDARTHDGEVAGDVDDGDAARRCGWCRRVLPQQSGRGRPRRFCTQRCRQWDWVSQKRADELRSSERELVAARKELDRMRDDLRALARAVGDVERDLDAPGERSATELAGALRWLLDAAAPLCGTDISPGRRSDG